ncbi:hypothetical protein Calag_1066 [Caldisphaera lagunensis DSM 15908]|uniref:Uncharacterized protein n=1 Tax=Caldisphaera lagunensis (strain DSM 15908 / JCM 11604 / ANMR 0165 / IC-154) TaxID=1056495 RepID=L0AA57_CALLD|nr:hypothetical protein [Caldisphaera lagunensis]AFZ70788.1 hypothetical protein Calag_1066 [Caldisphaera lagunensis DSM 15908]
MEKYFKEIIIGFFMLLFSFVLTYFGKAYQNLWILVFAMSFSLAGALIGLRGLVEFLTKVFKK